MDKIQEHMIRQCTEMDNAGSFDIIKFGLADSIYLRELNEVIYPSMALGIYPTMDEWREIKHKIDNFYSTFTSADIQRSNDLILNPPQREYPKEEKGVKGVKERKPKSGYVYLLHHNGLYKIGMAKSITQRLTQISPVMPHKITLVCSVKTADMFFLEATLHERYAEKRMNGEWFSLSPSDVQDVMNMEQAQ